MRKIIRALLLLLTMTGGTALAMAQNFASPAEARAMLDKAAVFLKENGPEDAARVFMDKGGPFRDRDLYVSMFRADDGVRLAHAYPRMVGRSVKDSFDANGLPYGKILLDTAVEKGSGSLDYKILNPMTGEPMDKTGFVRKVGGFILVVGAYR